MNIIILTIHYTRAAVAQDTTYLYLFTDNQERTSRPDAPTENIDPQSWYYQKYKPTTTKPLHFGSVNNPTSAVIRGLNNAYPISTFTWIMVPEQELDPQQRSAISDLLRWMLTSGQKQCSALGYAPLPHEVAVRELQSITALK